MASRVPDETSPEVGKDVRSGEPVLAPERADVPDGAHVPDGPDDLPAGGSGPDGTASTAPDRVPRPRNRGTRAARPGVVGPFSGRQLLAAALVVVVAGLVLVIATLPIAPAAPAGPIDARPTQYAIGPAQVGFSPGDLAPELTVTASDGSSGPIRDLSGNPISLAALRGHPVWINFWASWCPPCQSETPTLRDLWSVYRSTGLVVVGISVQEATVDDVRAYAAKYGLTYPIAADLRGDLFRAWHVYGLPTQFFIDGHGVIQAVIQGPVTPDTARAALAKIGVTPPGALPVGSAAPVGPAAPVGSAAPVGPAAPVGTAVPGSAAPAP